MTRFFDYSTTNTITFTLTDAIGKKTTKTVKYKMRKKLGVEEMIVMIKILFIIMTTMEHFVVKPQLLGIVPIVYCSAMV